MAILRTLYKTDSFCCLWVWHLDTVDISPFSIFKAKGAPDSLMLFYWKQISYSYQYTIQWTPFSLTFSKHNSWHFDILHFIWEHYRIWYQIIPEMWSNIRRENTSGVHLLWIYREDENLRGGAGQKVRKSTDPRIRQICFWRVYKVIFNTKCYVVFCGLNLF